MTFPLTLGAALTGSQNHVVPQMDHHPHRAALHRDISGDLLCRSNMVHEQSPVLRRLFPRHTSHHASIVDPEVSLFILQ